MYECPLCRAQAGDGGLICSGCVANTLFYKQQAIAYKKVALNDIFHQAEEVLAARKPLFDQQQAVASLLRRQSELKEQLHQTAERVRGLRPSVARKKFMLEDRRRALRVASERLEEMDRRHEGRSAPVLEGLRWYMEQAQAAVHQRVWIRVLEHFVILPIEADLPNPARVSSVAEQKQPPPPPPANKLGISTIAGLPLPNSGRYSGLGLPDEVCEAALCLVARLTCSLAKTFGVTLPHPLLFPVGKPYAIIAEDVQRRTEFVLSPIYYKKERGDGQKNRGTSAGGRESQGVVVARTPDGEAADPFNIGLEYLQYDVHRLAISKEVGIDLSALWGKEALLLNLWAIQQHAARLVQSYDAVPDLPLPVVRRKASQGYQVTRPQQQQQQQQQQPTVVFEDREESEWSLVDLQLKNAAAAAATRTTTTAAGVGR